MAEGYSFFNSKDHDRIYNARHWADYFFPLFKSGVFNGDLQVVANGGMSVKINPGYAWIDGYSYHLTDGLVLDLETASGNMNRADSIVIRLDLTNRWIKAFCKTGSYYAGVGVPPEPEITATIHEIVIAHISVAAGATEIMQEMIEDTRMNESLCGWVCGAVDQIKFEQIYAQFQAYQKTKVDEIHEWLNQFQNDTENELKEWFDNIREQLTEDPAINLQEQIGRLEDLSTEHKNNIVEAVNEVKENCHPTKLSNSAAITTPGEYALDATEKNAAIKGTLAHQIAQVNGSLSAWELIGSSVGKAPVTFEADIYSEITCICQIPVSGTSDIYQIPTIVLGSTEKIFSHGNSGYKAIGTFFVNIYASSTSIRIQYAEANSGDVTNQANFSVYGR